MIVVALILLGVGWNFSYTGGSAFLTMNVKGDYALKWQGVNDTVISIFAALGAFFPSIILAFIGWNTMNIVGIAIIIFFWF